MNCAYTIQPTSGYDPKIPVPTSDVAPPAPYATGRCGLHVIQALGAYAPDPVVAVQATVKDADGNTLKVGSKGMGWGDTLTVDSVLPFSLKVTPQSGLKDKRHVKRIGAPTPPRPLLEHGPIDFEYGSQSWDTSSKSCSVGDWDNGNFADFVDTFLGEDFLSNRQMDCSFDCPWPLNKRSIEATEESPEEKSAVKGRRGQSSLQLLPRAPPTRDATWKEAATRGKKLWNAWKAKDGPDAPPAACDFTSKYHQLIHITRPERRLAPLLEGNGNSADPENWLLCDLSLQNPRTNPQDGSVAWSNLMNVPEGVIVALANYRGYPNPEPENGVEVVWYEWQQSVLQYHREHGLDDIDVNTADFSGISSYFRIQISNTQSLAVLKQAFEDGKPNDELRTWTPDDEDEDKNPFWAVLGSNNGKGIIRLLTDHKRALRGKGIKELKAKYMVGQGDDFFFWANFH